MTKHRLATKNENNDNSSREYEEKQCDKSTKAIMIQSLFRKHRARNKVVKLCQELIEPFYDQEYDRYFYFNHRTGESSWTKPALMKNEPTKIEIAANRIQKWQKTRSRKRKIEKEKNEEYIKTRKVSFDITLNANDNEAKDKEITHLQEMLRRREEEIDHFKKAREETDQQQQSREYQVFNSKEIDSWQVKDVLNWFESLGLGAYRDNIIKFKIDGLLLMNLERKELFEIGITSNLDVKKIELHLKRHKSRHKVKNINELTHNDDVTSSERDNVLDSGRSTPSDRDDDEINSDTETIDIERMSDTNEEGSLSESGDEQVLDENNNQETFDENTVSIEVLCPGEQESRPYDGCVVQIHYTIAIAPTEEVIIESSRNRQNKPFEFVVGAGQVIKGWDFAIKQINRGERSRVIIWPESGYGDKGVAPLIPGNATLICDIELIDFWVRPYWIKPWIQQPGLSQKPYAKDTEKENRAYFISMRTE